MDTIQDLIVVGAGGFGREVVALVRMLPGAWRPVGFLDDDNTLHGSELSGLPVLGAVRDWVDYSQARFVVAVGNPRVRRDIVQEMAREGTPGFTSLVHPNAEIMERVHVGEGSILCSGIRLTVDIKVGQHVIMNILSTVGHDSILGDYVTLAPHAAVSGAVSLGAGVELGTKAVIVPGITIGRGSCICAGAVATKHLPDNVVAAGAPCRRVKVLEPF